MKPAFDETAERLLEERQFEALDKLCLRAKQPKETLLWRAELALARGDAGRAEQLLKDETSPEAGNLRALVTGQGQVTGETRLAGLALERLGRLPEALALYEKQGKPEAQARVLVAMGTAESLRRASKLPAFGPARTAALRRLAALVLDTDGGAAEARACVLLLWRERRLGADDAWLCALTLEGPALRAALESWRVGAPEQPALAAPAAPAALERAALAHPEPAERDAALAALVQRAEEAERARRGPPTAGGWRALYDGALAAGRLGRPAAGLALLQRALQGWPHVPRLWLLAARLAEPEQPALARRLARCAAARFPEHFEALLLHARLAPSLQVPPHLLFLVFLPSFFFQEFLPLMHCSDPEQQSRVWQALAARTRSEEAAAHAVRCAPLSPDALCCAARSKARVFSFLSFLSFLTCLRRGWSGCCCTIRRTWRRGCGWRHCRRPSWPVRCCRRFCARTRAAPAPSPCSRRWKRGRPPSPLVAAAPTAWPPRPPPTCPPTLPLSMRPHDAPARLLQRDEIIVVCACLVPRLCALRFPGHFAFPPCARWV